MPTSFKWQQPPNMKLKKSENGLGVTFEPATRRHSLALIDLLDNFMRSKNALFKTNVKKSTTTQFQNEASIHTHRHPHTCPTVVDMSRTIFYPPPLKNSQNFIPPHLDPCPQPFFPPPIWNFGHIFPYLKNILHKDLMDNEISLMENAIYPP